MDSENLDRIVNLVTSESSLRILEIVALDGLLMTDSLNEMNIKIVPADFYNPQDPMFVVTHESNNKQIGQISFWEHNQLLLEVLDVDGNHLLMRQFTISSSDEIDIELREYFNIMKAY